MFFVPFGGAKVSCGCVSCKAFGNYFRNIFALCLKVALLKRVLGGFGGDRCGFEGFAVWWRVFGVSFVGALMVIFFECGA